MKDFSYLKAGDFIVVKRSLPGGDINFDYHLVKKITPKGFIRLDDDLLYKKDGTAHYDEMYADHRLMDPNDEETQKMIKEYNRQRFIRYITKEMHNISSLEITYEQAVMINAILNGAKKINLKFSDCLINTFIQKRTTEVSYAEVVDFSSKAKAILKDQGYNVVFTNDSSEETSYEDLIEPGEKVLVLKEGVEIKDLIRIYRKHLSEELLEAFSQIH